MPFHVECEFMPRISKLMIIVLLFVSPVFAKADTIVEKYFENTDNELTIYRINGKEPGKTMMIIGGIQGDEPGGYIAADLYADLLLEVGNLIVVPRANFLSIRQNSRGVNGDMNRKFAPKTVQDDDYDSRIVEILKSLMAESDVLLNLHEGSGYYSPVYISDNRNPMRYGQSIIIDTDVYTTDNGRKIDIKGPAERVIANINATIRNEDHTFHLNNHDTFSNESRHKEQRGSATYNALSLFGIPGYGIETSKSIRSIETKVQYETIAINAFMQEFGIVPQHPSVYLPAPELEHLVVSIAGNPNPLAIKNKATLSLKKGSSITVTSVVANYRRGISVDILGHGITNDLNRSATITQPTTIRVYKDSFECGEVKIDITAEEDIVESPHVHIVSLDHMSINCGGNIYRVAANDTLEVVNGDKIKIENAATIDPLDRDFRVNFRGFVGNKAYNDAEDTGYLIDTGRDILQRYSLNSDYGLYRIDMIKNNDIIGSTFLKIIDSKIEYVIIDNGKKERLALAPGETLECAQNQSFKILSIVSNVSCLPCIEMFLSSSTEKREKVDLAKKIEISGNSTLHFTRSSKEIGIIRLKPDGKT